MIVTLTLDANITEISNATDRANFETSFKHDVVDLLEISIKRILILNLTAGSIKIECMILPDGDGRPISDAKVLSTLPLGVPIAGYELLKPPEIFTAWKSHLQNSARQDTYQDYTKMKEFIETRREELYKELTTKLNSTLNDINTDRQSKGESTWTMAEWMNTKRDSDANNEV